MIELPYTFEGKQMRKSLIETIGRDRAHRLMSDAVMKAIAENEALGLSKPSRLSRVEDNLCIVSGDQVEPLIDLRDLQSGSQARSRLKKRIRIA